MNSFIDDFRAAMKSHGLDCSVEIKADGVIHRFGCDKDKDDPCWYVLFNGDMPAGAFGCWKRQIDQKWHSQSGKKLSGKELFDAQKRWKEAAAQRQQQEVERHERMSQKAISEIASLKPATEHFYLQSKGVSIHGKVLYTADDPPDLLLSLQDASGKIWSYQTIDGVGDKLFMPGGRVQGCYFELSDRKEGPLVICEGYATGASIYEATGWAVVCAMNCGNLKAVSQDLRDAWPERTIVLAADNDRFTEGNPGLTKATEAAKAIKASVAVPEFSDSDTSSSDFNDLACISGVSSVLETIRQAISTVRDWSIFVCDGSNVLTENIPDPVAIVDKLLPEQSKLIIGASSKSYKTWLSMDMAISLSMGVPFIGLTCLQRNVLYVNLELKDSTFKRRLQMICRHRGLKLPRGAFHHLSLRGKISGLNPSQVVTAIIQTARFCSARVVFLDPVYKVNTEGEENNARDQTRLFNELDRITTECGCALVLNDHFSKGNQSEKDPLDAIRGSSAKGGDIDAGMILRPHQEKDSYSVDVIHRELPPVESFTITWGFPVFRINESLDPSDMKKSSGGRPKTFDSKKALLAIIERNESNPVSISEWADLAGIKRTTLLPYLTDMRASGWIITVGGGSHAKQAITEAGKSYVSK